MQTLQEWQCRERHGKPIKAAASILPDLDAMSSHTIGFSPFIWTVPFNESIENYKRDILLHFCVDAGTDSRRRATHKVNRASIVTVLEKNGFVNRPRACAAQYWEDLQRSVFVVSPEGNGIDCHRTYEALWCGCIPIVERVNQKHIRQLYGNVPILWTNDYSEITPEYLWKMHNAIQKMQFDFSKLYYESLSSEQQEQVHQRSLFWYEVTKGGTTIPPNMWESHRQLLLSSQKKMC